jgi:hypothetical protein
VSLQQDSLAPSSLSFDKDGNEIIAKTYHQIHYESPRDDCMHLAGGLGLKFEKIRKCRLSLDYCESLLHVAEYLDIPIDAEKVFVCRVVYEVEYLEVKWVLSELETNKIDVVPPPSTEEQAKIKKNAALTQARYHTIFKQIKASRKTKDMAQAALIKATKRREKAEKTLEVNTTDLTVKTSEQETATSNEILKKTELETAKAKLEAASKALDAAKEEQKETKQKRQEVLAEVTKCNRELSEFKTDAEAKAEVLKQAKATHIEKPNLLKAVRNHLRF